METTMKSFIHSGIVFFLMLVLLDGCLEDEITIEYLEEPVVEEEEVTDRSWGRSVTSRSSRVLRPSIPKRVDSK